jgi:hypothetical protein
LLAVVGQIHESLVLSTPGRVALPHRTALEPLGICKISFVIC